MKQSVIAMTIEKNGITSDELDAMKTFSGKNAGICCLKETFTGAEALSAVKCTNRFLSTAKNGHHSIADHVKVEILFESCSKMMAIVLNSLQDYCTSEKSGRFTEMTGNSPREIELYSKWKGIFRQVLLKQNPTIDDKSLSGYVRAKSGDETVIVENGVCDSYSELVEQARETLTLPSEKMAQENARYILSIFTHSTTFGYTTSLRQWNYIHDWAEKYLAGTKDDNFFDQNLREEMTELRDFIRGNLYVEDLRDTKGRCFEFLTDNAGVGKHPMSSIDMDVNELEVAGVAYTISYFCSYCSIAQSERHRTLKYFMSMNKLCPTEYGFFTPDFIVGSNWESEWFEDLESVKDLIPQATLIKIVETGFIGDFLLKCKERLCGAAQFETMTVVHDIADEFVRSRHVNDVVDAYVSEFADSDGRLKTKCEMCGGCKLQCFHGAKNALSRNF